MRDIQIRVSIGRPMAWLLAHAAPCVLGLLIVIAASVTGAQTVFVFEGHAVSATRGTDRPCAGPCDDPNWPFGPGPISDEAVAVYQNVAFRVAFLASSIAANIPGYDWDGAWSETSLYLAADSETETITTEYLDSSQNTVVQTVTPSATSFGPLYLHSDSGSGPTFGSTGSSANFTPGSPSGAPTDFVEGFWGWSYGASDPDPFSTARNCRSRWPSPEAATSRIGGIARSRASNTPSRSPAFRT